MTTKQIAIVTLTLTALTGCATEAPEGEASEAHALYDACSGEIIGTWHDGRLELESGRVIDPDMAEMRAEGFEELDELADMVCAEQAEPGVLPKSATGYDAGGCFFWEIVEETRDGSYGCAGGCCCSPGNTCSCYEECYDYTHS